MVKAIHPFAKLSPEERQKEITPGDVWPVSSISFDREKGEMVMAIRHHASATDMLKVPGSRELLGSAALWWASLTEKLYPLDAKDLAEEAYQVCEKETQEGHAAVERVLRAGGDLCCDLW